MELFDPTFALQTARLLIAEQFPIYANLAIKPVACHGNDNRSFRLGENFLIRMPSAASYAAQVEKEQTWLPRIAPFLPLPIPQPLALGSPSHYYPWPWSIYRWIEGTSANQTSPTNKIELAENLADFLNALQAIKLAGQAPLPPLPGPHNFWRGGDFAIYAMEAHAHLQKLKPLFEIHDLNTQLAEEILEKAISSQWHYPPVWLHGDIAVGNMIIKDGHLAAIIDFGCMATGDPACDYVIAWTFLEQESREMFKTRLKNFDQTTAERSRGWALWKACFALVQHVNISTRETNHHLQTIQEVLNDSTHP